MKVSKYLQKLQNVIVRTCRDLKYVYDKEASKTNKVCLLTIYRTLLKFVSVASTAYFGLDMIYVMSKF